MNSSGQIVAVQPKSNIAKPSSSFYTKNYGSAGDLISAANVEAARTGKSQNDVLNAYISAHNGNVSSGPQQQKTIVPNKVVEQYSSTGMSQQKTYITSEDLYMSRFGQSVNAPGQSVDALAVAKQNEKKYVEYQKNNRMPPKWSEPIFKAGFAIGENAIIKPAKVGYGYVQAFRENPKGTAIKTGVAAGGAAAIIAAPYIFGPIIAGGGIAGGAGTIGAVTTSGIGASVLATSAYDIGMSSHEAIQSKKIKELRQKDYNAYVTEGEYFLERSEYKTPTTYKFGPIKSNKIFNAIANAPVVELLTSKNTIGKKALRNRLEKAGVPEEEINLRLESAGSYASAERRVTAGTTVIPELGGEFAGISSQIFGAGKKTVLKTGAWSGFKQYFKIGSIASVGESIPQINLMNKKNVESGKKKTGMLTNLGIITTGAATSGFFMGGIGSGVTAGSKATSELFDIAGQAVDFPGETIGNAAMKGIHSIGVTRRLPVVVVSPTFARSESRSINMNAKGEVVGYSVTQSKPKTTGYQMAFKKNSKGFVLNFANSENAVEVEPEYKNAKKKQQQSSGFGSMSLNEVKSVSNTKKPVPTNFDDLVMISTSNPSNIKRGQTSVPAVISNDQIVDMPDDIPNNLPSNLPEDISNQNNNDIPEDVSNEVPEDVPDILSDQTVSVPVSNVVGSGWLPPPMPLIFPTGGGSGMSGKKKKTYINELAAGGMLFNKLTVGSIFGTKSILSKAKDNDKKKEDKKKKLNKSSKQPVFGGLNIKLPFRIL